MPPKFKLGDAVILKQSLRQNVPGGVCVVTKVLPDRDGDREYRVKSPEESTSGSRGCGGVLGTAGAADLHDMMGHGP